MKWLKIFLLSSPLFICALGLFGLSGNASAYDYYTNNPNVGFTTKIYNTATQQIVQNVSSGTPPFTVLTRPQTQSINYLVGMTIHAISTTSFSYNDFTTFYMDFQLRVVGGDGLYTYFSNVPISSKIYAYDNGTTTSNFCELSTYVNNTYYQYHCAVSLPQNSSPDYIYLDIGDTLATSAPFTPVAGIPSYDTGYNTHIDLNFLGYGYDSSASQTDAYLNTLTQQNQTIINQNQQIIEQQQATNDWLTDDTAPSADTSSLGNAAGWLPAGPLDSILNLPIQFIQGIIGVFTNSNTCSPIVVPLGLVDYNLEIPCMRPFFELASVNIVWNTVGTIISAVLIFHTIKWLYKFVDDTLSFRENNSTMWGGL